MVGRMVRPFSPCARPQLPLPRCDRQEQEEPRPPQPPDSRPDHHHSPRHPQHPQDRPRDHPQLAQVPGVPARLLQRWRFSRSGRRHLAGWYSIEYIKLRKSGQSVEHQKN